MSARLLLQAIVGFGDPSVKEFVEAVIYVTRGELYKLKEDYSEVNSIYGNISERLCGQNKLLYRKWIYSIFQQNRHNCKVQCIERALKKRSQLTPLFASSPTKDPVQEPFEGSRCCGICTIAYKQEIEGTNCHSCGGWFDQECILRVAVDYTSQSIYICPNCTTKKLIRIPFLLTNPDQIRVINEDEATKCLEVDEDAFTQEADFDDQLHVSFSAETSQSDILIDSVNEEDGNCVPSVSYNAPLDELKVIFEEDEEEEKFSTSDFSDAGTTEDDTAQVSSNDDTAPSSDDRTTKEKSKSPTCSTWSSNSSFEDLEDSHTRLTQDKSILTSQNSNEELEETLEGDNGREYESADADEHENGDRQSLSSVENVEEDKCSSQDTDVNYFIDYSEKQIRHFTKFMFHIPWKIFATISPVGFGKTKKLQENWTDVFYNGFKDKNPECNIMFRKHRVSSSNRSNCSLITAEAYCTREHCDAYYFLRVYKVPQDQSNVEVHVSLKDGTQIKHRWGEIFQRPVARNARKMARETLKTVAPRKYRDYLLKDANQDHLNKGNFNSVQYMHKWRKIRYEARQQEELHKDLGVAIHMLQKQFQRESNKSDKPSKKSSKEKPNNQISGFIHHTSLDPVMIICYTRTQIKLLRDLLIADSKVCIHLDATSNIISTLKAPYCDSKVDVYFMAVSSQLTDVEPIIIADFYTSDTTMPPIAFFLSHILHNYRLQYKVTDPSIGIMRWETDFAPATITAILQATQFGTTLHYLQAAWECLVNRTPMVICVHVCKWHASVFLDKKIKEHVLSNFNKEDQKVSKPVLKTWKYGYLHSRDLASLCRRIEDILVICGSVYESDEVSRRIETISTTTDRTRCAWEKFAWKDSAGRHGAIKWNSPFSLYAMFFAKKNGIDILSGNKSSSAEPGLPKNAYYSPEFLDYLTTHVFPYSPLMSHSILALNGFTLEDTNNASETANSMVKSVDFGPSELPMKLTRFIRIRKTHLEEKNKLWIAAVEARKMLSQRSQPRRCPDQTTGDINFSSDVWKKPNRSKTGRIHEVAPIDLRFLPYGGKVAVKGVIYELHNSCSIDNTVIILNYIYSLSEEAKQFIHDQCQKYSDSTGPALLSFFKKFVEHKYTDAKKIWMMYICKIGSLVNKKGQTILDRSKHVIDLFGSEQERGLSVISQWFQLDKHYQCENPACKLPNVERVSLVDDFVAGSSVSFMFAVNQRTTGVCDACKSKAKCFYKFPTEPPPPFVAYCIAPRADNIFEESLIPKDHKILKVKYKLIAYTLVMNPRKQSAHIITIFQTSKGKVCYDGLKNDFVKYTGPTANCVVNTIWLIRKQ